METFIEGSSFIAHYLHINISEQKTMKVDIWLKYHSQAIKIHEMKLKMRGL
jgi:hypothetical protein